MSKKHRSAFSLRELALDDEEHTCANRGKCADDGHCYDNGGVAFFNGECVFAHVATRIGDGYGVVAGSLDHLFLAVRRVF